MATSIDWTIEADIRRAATLPSAAYRDARIFELTRQRVFARSWQWAGDADGARVPGQVQPFTLLEGLLDEPLLLARDGQDALRCLSNVCTHRGTVLCQGGGVESVLRCRYHGRRFALDGRLLSMPEFEGVEGYPSAADNLRQVPLGRWGKFLFVNLADGANGTDGADGKTPVGVEGAEGVEGQAAEAAPLSAFAELVAPMAARLSWLPLGEAVFDPTRSRDYLVRAHWALYCDNYLEGFHIPYVHAALAGALDYGSYRTELYPWASLQLGVAGDGDGDDVFDLPPGSPDHGQSIAAYYYWLFPNTMVNVYPWGISINVVRPLAPDRTKVSFLSYVWDPARLDRGAGSGLDRVEREDEAVVESVHRGLASRIYRRGRYSPAREQGVHHFHRLLTRCLAGEL
jgi:choline monooxygenase